MALLLLQSYYEFLIISLILFLPFLYEKSYVFRYYIKFFIYYFYVMINSVILIPFFMLRPCDVKNLLTASAFCQSISTLIGIKWELRGKEHLQKEQSCIIVANHQSSLDILGMFDIWPVMNKCTVVAKREIFYAWPFGLAAWLCGLIFIDRMHSEKARDTLNNAIDKIKKKNIKLWVFPEGTRRITGDIHPFKKGAFHVAIKAQIPILPIVFSSYQNYLDDKNKIFESGKVIITTLPPISTEGMTPDDVLGLIDETRKQMLIAYKETTQELKSSSLMQNIQMAKQQQQQHLMQKGETVDAINLSSDDIKANSKLERDDSPTVATVTTVPERVDNNKMSNFNIVTLSSGDDSNGFYLGDKGSAPINQYLTGNDINHLIVTTKVVE